MFSEFLNVVGPKVTLTKKQPWLTKKQSWFLQLPNKTNYNFKRHVFAFHCWNTEPGAGKMLQWGYRTCSGCCGVQGVSPSPQTHKCHPVYPGLVSWRVSQETKAEAGCRSLGAPASLLAPSVSTSWQEQNGKTSPSLGIILSLNLKTKQDPSALSLMFLGDSVCGNIASSGLCSHVLSAQVFLFYCRIKSNVKLTW